MLKNLLWVIILLLMFANLYGYKSLGGGFPQKSLVYQALKIPPQEYSKISIITQKYDYMEFSYEGKKYKAHFFGYGGIYLERPQQNPLWICYDVKEFKTWKNFRFVDYEQNPRK